MNVRTLVAIVAGGSFVLGLGVRNIIVNEQKLRYLDKLLKDPASYKPKEEE